MTLSLEELDFIKSLLNQYVVKKQLSFDTKTAKSALSKFEKILSDFEEDCINSTGEFSDEFNKVPFSVNYDKKDIILAFEDSKQTEFEF